MINEWENPPNIDKIPHGILVVVKWRTLHLFNFNFKSLGTSF